MEATMDTKFSIGDRVVVTDEYGKEHQGVIEYYYKERYIVWVPMTIKDEEGTYLEGLSAVCTEDTMELL